MSQPLEGIRVLDFTRVYSGPYATLMLSDMGAEVVKVEHPAHGDDSRLFGPFVGGSSGYFETLNRGKKSITVDYQLPEGQALLRQLVGDFDVVVENFRPGVMSSYGLDAACLRACYPRLIYVSISGYGQFGSAAQRGAYDVVIQAVSGLMSLTGLPELPLKTGPALADAISGLTAAVGLLGALVRRERTGAGATVDIAMMDSVFAVLENALAAYDVEATAPGRHGNADGVMAPFDCYPARDGWIVIAVGSERLWRRLVEVVGASLDQPMFATNARRLQHQSALNRVLADWCAQASVSDLLARLHEAGVPAGAVRSIEELAHDVHLEARGMLLRLQPDDDSTVIVPGSPLHISEMERPTPARAPRLGEHTNEILRRSHLLTKAVLSVR